MNKKITAVILIFILTVLTFSGCLGSQSTKTDDNNKNNNNDLLDQVDGVKETFSVDSTGGDFSLFDESGNDDDKTVNYASYPVMSGADFDILDNSYEEYESLRTAMSAEDARQQLIDDLNNTDGVEKAELGADLSTIFIECSDGVLTAVDTYELDEELPPTMGFMKENLPATGGLKTNSAIEGTLPVTSKLVAVGSSEKITCQNKKMLVLGPCYYDFPKQATDDTIQYFRDQGWSDDDITLKLVSKAPYETDTDCFDISPSDYFNQAEYGIILYIGHGDVKARKNFDEDNLYLQFCFLTNKSFIDNPELQEWMDDEKLVVYEKSLIGTPGSRYFVYSTLIRADLLRQKISSNKLQSSYCYFATCYGIYFKDIYLENGAEIFCSWDNLVNGKIADENMENLARQMLQDSKCVYDSYIDTSVVKSYTPGNLKNPDRGAVPAWSRHPKVYSKISFFVGPDPKVDETASNFYMPSWIDLTINDIPDSSTSFTVGIYDGTNLLAEAGQSIALGTESYTIDYVGEYIFTATEDVIVKVEAFDSSGSSIGSGETTVNLEVGENVVQVEMIMQATGVSIEFDYPYENGQLDVLKDRYLSMDARVENRPSGEFLNVWDSLGDASLGGFGLSKLQHYETDDIDVFFYPSGTGTDGEQIPISLSVYHVVGDDKELLGTVTASIDVYNPTTRYEIVDQNDEKRYMGSGSMWSFYNVGHGSIFSSGFYARSGDQLRITCRDKGYIPEWESYQVYLKGPAGNQYLLDISELPESMDEDSYDKTFTIQ